MSYCGDQTLRILHTADWHLGRLFHGAHLTEEQAYVLDQVVSIVGDMKPDLMVVAGDVYDRAVPPTEAVTLLDETLWRIQAEHAMPIVVISGNHDSPERLAFGSRALAERGLHVAARPGLGYETITLADEHGPVDLYAVPYADPPVTRQWLGDNDIHDHDAAMKGLVGRIKSDMNAGSRNVLVAHTFVGGGAESESERPLAVGGASCVSSASLAGFDYVALGHLHCPQQIGSEAIRYSGSLMKYSFSEASHQKSVTMVELDAKGDCTTEFIPLTPRHNLRRLKGKLDQLIDQGRSDSSPHDYIAVTLLDEGAVLDPIGRLREVYPNVLQIERLNDGVEPGDEAEPRDHRGRDDVDLFEDFFGQVTGGEFDESRAEAFREVVQSMDRDALEADR